MFKNDVKSIYRVNVYLKPWNKQNVNIWPLSETTNNTFYTASTYIVQPSAQTEKKYHEHEFINYTQNRIKW